MDGTKTQKYRAAVIAGGFGVLTCLEAFGITDVGNLSADIPRWLLALVGALFIVAALMIVVPMSSAMNHLMASLIITSMGLICGWIGLFGAASGFSGGAAAVAELTGFPLQRVVFALGALFCFGGAAYALSCFVRALRA